MHRIEVLGFFKFNAVQWMLLLLMALPLLVQAQLVTRGPYLQTATPDSIIVMWRTDIATSSAVRFGLTPGNLNQIASNTDLVDDHEITLSGLTPNTRYYYSVGTVAAELAGDASYALTTPPLASSDKPARVWFLGDSGTKDANAAAVRDAYLEFNGSRDTDLIVMLGDNAYNIGSDIEYQAAVFDMYPELLRKVPLWPAMGNHDGIDIFFNNSTAYYDMFSLPTLGEAGGVPSGSELYYSFDYGDIHFICLDSMISSRAAGGSMMTWFESDLVANDKFWTVVFWHHPPYSKGSHDSDTEDQLIDMRENAVPLLEEYGVDLVLSGHSHSYERSVLLNGNHDVSTTLTPSMVLNSGSGQEGGDGAYIKASAPGTADEGAVYIVAGSSGKTEAAPLDHPVMFSSLLELGSVVMDVSGNRMELSFVDDAGNVKDYFTMIKNDDIHPPGIVEANSSSYVHTDVVFAEPVDTATAEDKSNYTVGDVPITDSALKADGITVRLTFDELLAPASTHTVVVSGVLDLSGNAIGVHNQRGFTTANPTPGDVDGDGNIDWWDIANMLGALDTPALGASDPADINGDGNVTIDDAWLVWNGMCELPRCGVINNP
jgi:acid phosphatase type 7